MNDFIVMIQTALETKGIKTDYNEMKKWLEKNPTKINTIMDVSATKTEVNKFIKEFAPQLQKMFSSKGVEVNLKDIESSMKSVFKESEKAAKQYQKEIQKMGLAELSAYQTNEKLKQDATKQRIKIEQDALSLDASKFNTKSNIDAFLARNTKMSKELRAEFLRLKASLDSVDDSKSLSNVNKELGTLKNNAKATGQIGMSMGDNFKEAFGKFSVWVSASAVFFGVQRVIKNMVAEVKNIDSAMISLKKVTDETNATYDRFLTSVSQKAKELGASISDIVNATADFARLGYNLPDAEKLGEVAVLYKNVGDGINIQESSSSIISTMKAFNIEAENSITIIDKFNEVGNRFAISSAGIGEALQKSASGLVAAGNTIDEAIALIVSANNVVQNPETVGQMWKTVSMRIRGAKTELEDAGLEIDGMAESTSKLREELKSLTNFDIMIDDNTFKSTYDIVLGISEVFDKLSDTSRANVLELLAGKRQGNALAAALNNAEDLVKTLEVSQQSSGSAMREQEKYQQGIEYSLDRLKASFQELSATTIDSSTIKFFVDFANAAINATTAVGGLMPVIITLGILLPTLKASFGTLNLSLIATQVQVFGLSTAFKTLIGTITTFLATNPVGWVLALGTALFGVKKIYDHFNVTLEEHQEILSQQAQAYDDATAKVKVLKDELESTRLKLEELNAIGGASVVKEGEQERLEAQTEELQRQLDIEEEKQRIAGESAEKEAIVSLTKTISSEFETYPDSSVRLGRITYDNVTRDVELQRIMDKYDEIIDKQTELKKKQQELANNKEGNSPEFKTNEKQLESLATRIIELKTRANELAGELQNEKESLIGVTEEGNVLKESINGVIDVYRNWTGTSEDVSDTNDEIVDTMSRIPTDQFDTLNKSLDELDKKSKDTVSSVKELNQVLYDQSQGTKLTSEQAYKLITQYPQLASALEKTTDGYTINEEAINDVREALINQEKANANAQLNMTRDTLNAVSDRVEAYGIELEAITSIEAATKEQSKLSLNSIFGDMDAWAFDDKTKRVTTPTGSYIANSTENEYDATKKAYQEQKLIYDTVGKMGNLQERINGLQNSLLSDKSFGVNKGKGGSGSGKEKDLIKEAFDLGTKDKKGKWIKGKNDLDHDLAMEEITQKQYLKGLEKINEATFGQAQDTHLENYRQYLEEVKKGRDQIDKKLSEDKIKSKFNDLSHSYAMGDIQSEDKYQKQRWNLAKKYYKNNEDYLDEWRKAQEEWYKWNLDQTEKSTALEQKKRLNTIDKIIDKYGELRDAINRTAENQTGNAQVNTYSEGIQYANKEIKYIENEIKKLNKRKITNLFTQDDYDSQLANLQSALSKARSSIDSFNKSISESIRKSSEDVMKGIEDSFKKTTDYWENQKKDYSDIIKAQKDILQLKKEQNEYEKSIAKKTKEISKIESRMADLSKAAMTGDRQANAELRKLDEELAKNKEELSDTQSDREHDLANDALDKALDDNNKVVDAKLKAIKTEYETQRDNQQKLYDQLIELTSKASNYSIEAYSKAIDEIASKMAQSGIGLGQENIASLKSIQAQSYNNANPVYSILGNKTNANKSQDTSSLSGLNKYLASQGYGIANRDKMVELAQALGLYNITSPDMVGTDQLGRANKNLIMEELKRLFSGSTFSKGGIAKLPKMMGEDGFALIKNEEPVLTVEQGKLFKELVNNIKPLNNLVKLSTPNLSGITNNNNSPNINIPITIQGNATPSTVSALNNAGNNIVKQIMDEVRKL